MKQTIRYFVLIVTVVVTSSCVGGRFIGSKEKCVRFVLPDNSEGSFYLVLDAIKGVEPEVVENHFVYTIPSTRVLFVRNFDSINGALWKNYSARDPNGTVIKSSSSFEASDVTQILLWVNGQSITKARQMVWYFVGSHKNRRKETEHYPE